MGDDAHAVEQVENTGAGIVEIDDKGAVTAGEWESIGDFGWLDTDGYLYIADRRTDLIMAGGANIYPATVSGRSMTERAFSDAPPGPPSEPALYQSRLEGLVYARAIHDLGAGVYFYMHGLRRETD
jgi:hypothetical protein